MRSLSVLSAFAAALTLSGCDTGGDTETVTVRETVTETAASSVPSEAPVLLNLYFLRGGKVWPEQRGVVTRPDIATVAIHQLFEGPATDLSTAIPSETRLRRLAIDGGVAEIEFAPEVTDRQARAQIVYTLTQFATVKRVSFNSGRALTRATFERETPAILVESPLEGEDVHAGFAVRGTANTFEATFNYELRDASNRVLTENFVTATSGTGTRGTFQFTVPYEVDSAQQSRLVVFEVSAADGSRINEVSIFLRLR